MLAHRRNCQAANLHRRLISSSCGATFIPRLLCDNSVLPSQLNSPDKLGRRSYRLAGTTLPDTRTKQRSINRLDPAFVAVHCLLPAT